MDINLAKSFLEVVATGRFVAAGQRLYISQSTESSRIRTLETALGQVLFERGNNGAVMTPAGEQFQNYATALVRVWQQAKQPGRVGDPDAGVHDGLSGGKREARSDNRP